MPITSTDLGTLWVCLHCMLCHANGECCDGTEHDREPLSAIAPNYGVAFAVDSAGTAVRFNLYTWTAGILREEHNDACLIRIHGGHSSKVPGDYECDCARRGFSRSSCEGCGTLDEGERHALTLWREVPPAILPDAPPAPIAALAA